MRRKNNLMTYRFIKRKPMYLILDTETTDLRPWQIAQLSYTILDQDLEVSSAKNFFFSIKHMNPWAERIHGFSKDKLFSLSWGKTFEHHVDEICDDLENYTLIAHNMWFDKKFMQKEIERQAKHYSPKDHFCTMKHFTNICKLPNKNGYTGYKRPKVSEVMTHLDISDDDVLKLSKDLYENNDIWFHDARFDTAALVAIIKKAELNVITNH